VCGTENNNPNSTTCFWCKQKKAALGAPKKIVSPSAQKKVVSPVVRIAPAEKKAVVPAPKRGVAPKPEVDSCSDASTDASMSVARWRCPGCKQHNHDLRAKMCCHCNKSRNPKSNQTAASRLEKEKIEDEAWISEQGLERYIKRR